MVEKYPKILWKPKGSSTLTLGYGAEWQSSEFPSFPLKEVECFAALRFSKKLSSLPWISMPESLFCIPKKQEKIPASSFDYPRQSLKILQRRDTPTPLEWRENIQRACRECERRSLDKIVLARKTTLEASEQIDPWSLAGHLLKIDPSSTIFVFQINSKHAFIGASPEILFHRIGRSLYTEALAGTLPRGQDSQEDAMLEKQLIHRDKERREFSHVEQFIRNSIEALGASPLQASPIKIHKTPYVQHLHRSFRIELLNTIGDIDIIRSLHPTPALGGFPREKAMELLHSLENFDRGWYGAPLGMLGSRETFLSVAIRSAFIEGSQIHLFAGTGIVEGSDSDKEWEELEHKIRLYTEYFYEQ